MKNSNILITICARGGSKGIPGKNIIEVNGKPLIAYTIEAATHLKRDCPVVELILNSQPILNKSEHAPQNSARSDYQRPAYLANDTCGKIDAIRHLVFHSERRIIANMIL